MLDLTQTKHAVVVGGGTAGWFAALTLRKLFSPEVKVTVIESANTPIVGVGEGGLVNFISALKFHQIDIEAFERETGAALKLGFSYEGWRNGNASDIYHHTFGSAGLPENSFKYRGSHPFSSAMIAHEFRDLSVSIADLDLITQNRTPKQAVERLLKSQGLSASFHFDAHKVGAYLKKVALTRHVSHQYGHVTQVGLSSDHTRVAYLKTDDGARLQADFIIDASGFSRAVLGKRLGVAWQSFKDYLPANRAIPFNLPHPQANPSLVTRAIAMDHGWMWQIPLKDRVGAGFVYSDRFLSDDAARDEITQKLGFTPEMRAPIQFEAGCFEQVWVSNVLAVGLASGFVEPLEATSIGQMLDQLGAFYRCAQECRALITDQQIDQFNQANLRYWHGVRDFIRMHYDTPRRDTAFWRHLADAQLPASYAALKATWQTRVPVDRDISAYQSAGWNGMFALQNWVTVAGSLGLISIDAAKRDLKSLSPDDQRRAAEFLDLAMHREAELKLGASKPKRRSRAS